MRVVMLTRSFSKQTGYIENMLPRYLARRGATVHLLTMDLPPYYWLKDASSYGTFDTLSAGTVEAYDGYILHVLAHRRLGGQMQMRGLFAKLRDLNPDVVQCYGATGLVPLELSVYQRILGFKLFTANHTSKSGFLLAKTPPPMLSAAALKTLLLRTLPGRFISRVTERCYAVTEDCAEIAWRYFGVARAKVKLMYLGVDTELFYPLGDDAARRQLRAELGFNRGDIVCIYTGKLTEEKNALVLAQAVAALQKQGLPYKALFIGSGEQRQALIAAPHSRVLEFMPHAKLADYYRAADVGVWPTTESISVLDAAASGLPIIISDQIYRGHIEGYGLTYRQDSVESLVGVLKQLCQAGRRQALGELAAAKMQTAFSWQSVAERRLTDYKGSI